MAVGFALDLDWMLDIVSFMAESFENSFIPFSLFTGFLYICYNFETEMFVNEYDHSYTAIYQELQLRDY